MYNKVLFSIGLFITSGTIIAMDQDRSSLIVSFRNANSVEMLYTVTFMKQLQLSESNLATVYNGMLSATYDTHMGNQELKLNIIKTTTENTLPTLDGTKKSLQQHEGSISSSTENATALNLFIKGYAGAKSDNKNDCVGMLLTNQEDIKQSLFVQLNPNEVTKFVTSALKPNSRQNHSSSSLFDLFVPLLGGLGLSVIIICCLKFWSK